MTQQILTGGADLYNRREALREQLRSYTYQEPLSLLNLFESDDIAITNNVTSDTGNVNVNTYAYENNGVNNFSIGGMFDNLINNVFGQVFNFATQGNSFRWSSLTDMFAKAVGYDYSRGDVLGLDKPVTGVTRNGNTLNLNSADGSTLEVETTDSVDSNIAVDAGDGDVSNFKVGDSYSSNVFTFDAKTKQYIGSSIPNTTNTIVVGADQTADVSVDFTTQTQNVDNLDASATTANLTATGSNFIDNTFAASAGLSNLFGNYFSNDTFIANAFGSTNVFFGQNCGFDTIVNSKSTDEIHMLCGLDEIMFAGQMGGNFAIMTTDGSTLVADGMKDRLVTVGSEVYSYAAATGTWTSASAAASAQVSVG